MTKHEGKSVRICKEMQGYLAGMAKRHLYRNVDDVKKLKACRIYMRLRAGKTRIVIIDVAEA